MIYTTGSRLRVLPAIAYTNAPMLSRRRPQSLPAMQQLTACPNRFWNRSGQRGAVQVRPNRRLQCTWHCRTMMPSNVRTRGPRSARACETLLSAWRKTVAARNYTHCVERRREGGSAHLESLMLTTRFLTLSKHPTPMQSNICVFQIFYLSTCI